MSSSTDATAAALAAAASMDAEQDRMMEERVIMVDMDDNPTGFETKRISHKNPNIEAGMLHRAFSVFLFNSAGELMLQQRAGAKVTFPLHWTNTCCSHPLYTDGKGGGEEEMTEARGVKRAAIRKLEHELGIKPEDVSADSLKWLTKIYYKATSDGEWGEHEVDWILFLQTDLPASAQPTLQLNYNEVEGIKYVNKQQLKEMIAQSRAGDLKLTPWFALIAERLLFGWWDRLDEIMKVGNIGEEQRTIIHRLS